MNTRTTTIVVLILLIGATMAGLLLWNQLPDQMASHWDVNDQVNGYTSRFWGVFMVPLMALAMFLLFLVVPVIDPLKANIAKFRGIFNLFILFVIAFMIYLYVLTLRWNLGYTGFGMSRAMLPAMGLLFILVGYLMRQSKRNWFIGIRTPWTLSSDYVWEKTHQLGAILFMASGLLAFIGGFFGGMTAFWFFLVPLISSTIFLLIYSFVLYQRETKA
jgi:uncharacterized membrane protein